MGSDLLTTTQIVGITGDEDPLTAADVRVVLERAYAPWQAALMLRLRGPLSGWEREQVRPPHKGGCGWYDLTFLSYGCDSRGIHGLIIDHAGDQSRVVARRAGFIGWRDAEQLIRGAATPATLAALLAAFEAYQAHLARWPGTKPGQSGPPSSAEDVAEGGRLLRAESAAWVALIRAEAPEQLDLFAEVA